MFGGGLSIVPTANGRDIDIVEEMNKIVNGKGNPTHDKVRRMSVREILENEGWI